MLNGLELLKSKCETPSGMGENRRTELLWDFQFQTDTQVMADQQDTLVLDKQEKKVVVIDEKRR